jgi:hypothetical protein
MAYQYQCGLGTIVDDARQARRNFRLPQGQPAGSAAGSAECEIRKVTGSRFGLPAMDSASRKRGWL